MGAKNLARANLPAQANLQLDLCLGLDRADGAALFAGAAVDADVRVDLILGIALRNRVHRAGICAGAAGNAFIGNFMCHDLLPPNILTADPFALLYHTFQK